MEWIIAKKQMKHQPKITLRERGKGGVLSNDEYIINQLANVMTVWKFCESVWLLTFYLKRKILTFELRETIGGLILCLHRLRSENSKMTSAVVYADSANYLKTMGTLLIGKNIWFEGRNTCAEDTKFGA